MSLIDDRLRGKMETGTRARLESIGCWSMFVIGVALCAFVLFHKSEKAPPDDFAYRQAAEELVKRRLRDPNSAEFGSSLVIRRPGKAVVICGTVNSKNGFGGMAGSQRYVAGNTVIIEDDVGSDGMDQLWKQAC